MPLSSLKSRIARLDAKHRMNATQVVGVIGGRWQGMIPDPERPGYLKVNGPACFETFAKSQQSKLLAELHNLADATTAVDAKASPVGTAATQMAPLKSGKPPEPEKLTVLKAVPQFSKT